LEVYKYSKWDENRLRITGTNIFFLVIPFGPGELPGTGKLYDGDPSLENIENEQVPQLGKEERPAALSDLYLAYLVIS
jgi:hypothetical protein